MGRYGHHNNHSRYPPRDKSNYRVSEDFSISNPEEAREELQKSPDYEKPNPIARISSNIKERYQKYNSPDERIKRRTEKLENLSYNAKKESLKAQIRKSKQIAPTNYGFGIGTPKKGSSTHEGVVHIPKTNYGSMDRMFGIGTTNKPAKVGKRKPSSEWGSFDRMFGF